MCAIREPCLRTRWTLAWSLSLSLSLSLIGGCASRPTTPPSDRPSDAPSEVAAPQPRGEDPGDAIAIEPPADPLAGLVGGHRARFISSYESRCSRSWDVTTYRGEIAVEIAANGAASVELSFDAHSVGGAWGSREGGDGGRHAYVYDPERCRWEGRAEPQGDGVRLALERTAGSASRCGPAYDLGGEPGPELELRCRADRLLVPAVSQRGDGAALGPEAAEPTERVEVGVLLCTAERRVAQLIRELIDPEAGTLPLSAAHRLQIQRDRRGLGDELYSVVSLDR